LCSKLGSIGYIAVISLMVLFLGGCVSSSVNTDTVSVVRVIDGDTVVIAGGQRVRYIGIDTPEVDPEEAFGGEAADVNRELVQGKVVNLEKDTSETDRYGRLLRYVWVDGTMVNIELVRRGLAKAKEYPPDTKYQSLLETAELEARLARRGMWIVDQDN
jgi:micrococcal nuclease